MATTPNIENLKLLKDHIESFPDFPSPGILFRDIFSVFRDQAASQALHSLVKDHALSLKGQIDVVFAIESRGFLFGPYIGQVLGIPFVPIRKKGKLPGVLERLEYGLEYGTDCIEVQVDGGKVGKKALIVDDLIATGGSLTASCQLLKTLGVEVVESFVIMELADLNGRQKVPSKVVSLLQF
uniref:Adenine phosphoribosyltransferase n=1 Tax=Cacopsylla melanoneura TaxID=428564 RepID=A0A8D8LXL1_9HEMI